MKSLLILLLLLISWCGAPDAQQHWAVIVGNCDYPHFQGRLPAIQYAENDAVALAKLLQSPGCEVQPERLSLLTGSEARHSALREILAQKLRGSTAQDLLMLFFIGHGIRKDNQFYLLFADSQPDTLDRTAISLRQLSGIIEAYVPARRLLICLDAYRSVAAIGESWQTAVEWTLPLENRQLCVVRSCAADEIAKERGGYGLFPFFFMQALRGIPYLNRTADRNNDGLITVSELCEHVCWNLRLSGLGQRPMFWGENQTILLRSDPQLPAIEIVKPRYIKAQGPTTVEVAGFIRFSEEIRQLRIGQVIARMGKLTPTRARALHTQYYQHTWWFAVELSLTDYQSRLPVEIVDAQGQKQQTTITLQWCRRGWHNEWMPPGMIRGQEQGIYRWKRDDSQMVYISSGATIVGMPPFERRELLSRLRHLHLYWKQRDAWLAQEFILKQLVEQGLRESNQAIKMLAQRVKTIYDRVTLLEKVSREVFGRGQKSSADKNQEKASQRQVQADSLTTPELPERKYFSMARELLENFDDDLRALQIQRHEAQDHIAYLAQLLHDKDGLARRWPNKVIKVPGYYIDRHELDNAHYRRFCDATLRPHAPPPWWDESYIFHDNYPVVDVSWEDAMAYAFWAGKALPTVNQWEKCARGALGQNFPWGDRLPYLGLANADVPPLPEGANELTLPKFRPDAVNTLPLSTSRCFHLAGNVQEWCLNLTGASPTKTLQLAGNEQRVSKGGSFLSPTLMLYSWFEHPFAATTRRSDLGFRCVVAALE